MPLLFNYIIGSQNEHIELTGDLLENIQIDGKVKEILYENAQNVKKFLDKTPFL